MLAVIFGINPKIMGDLKHAPSSDFIYQRIFYSTKFTRLNYPFMGNTNLKIAFI